METWIDFGRLTKGMNLSDTIEAFFEYAENIDADAFLEGIEHLTGEGKLILALLISMEVMLAELSDPECKKIDPTFLLTTSYNLKELIKASTYEDKEQILNCLQDLRDAYPETFLILDDRAAHA